VNPFGEIEGLYYPCPLCGGRTPHQHYLNHARKPCHPLDEGRPLSPITAVVPLA
jgi:hypothetical protein